MLGKYASFEVKAGEIAVIDNFFVSAIQRDLNHCKWTTQKTVNLLNCPLSKPGFTYVPSEQLQLDNLIKKKLTSKQIKAIVKRPITLGVLVKQTPLQYDAQGYNTYVIKAEGIGLGEYKLIEMPDDYLFVLKKGDDISPFFINSLIN